MVTLWRLPFVSIAQGGPKVTKGFERETGHSFFFIYSSIISLDIMNNQECEMKYSNKMKNIISGSCSPLCQHGPQKYDSCSMTLNISDPKLYSTNVIWLIISHPWSVILHNIKDNVWSMKKLCTIPIPSWFLAHPVHWFLSMCRSNP